MKPFILIISALATGLWLGGSAGAQAQAPRFTVGPRVGVQRTHQTSYSNYYAVGNGGFAEDPHRYGLQAGVAGNLQFSHWAVQPAVLFSQKGYTFDFVSEVPYSSITYHAHETRKVRLNYLEVPVNLVVSTREAGGLQLIAGAYAGLALSGRQTDKAWTEEAPVNEYGYFANRPAQSQQLEFGPYTRYDLGLNGGIGYKYQNLQLQALYGLGLRRAGNQQGTEAPRNRSIQLAAAYFLPLASK